jgi:hypothetical protein
MQQTTKIIQKRYEGFLQTACLWIGKAVCELEQFEITPKFIKIDLEIDEKLRLGKYIERFVSYQLAQENGIKIISENIQIQQNKITLGELDCILLKDEKPIHLEIIYKFYLFDSTIGTSEIEHFIGPNRKDSLIEKLNKLKEKQLPLLYTSECLTYLKTINIKVDDLTQQVYFKAQLFIPFSAENIVLKKLNNACIVGFYLNRNELHQFTDCKFFIPNKKDWLLLPNQNVNWLNFHHFTEKATAYLEREFSPLCWMKKENVELHKFFLVWWY